jgi:hypothetical protein
MLGVRTSDFHFVHGRDLIATYEAPLLETPPPYRASFRRRCGSPVPNPEPAAEWFEIPAGLLESEPGLRPDKHIFVELKAPWYEITDSLPQFDKTRLRALRASQPRTRRDNHP